jgi:hypothetical protein
MHRSCKGWLLLSSLLTLLTSTVGAEPRLHRSIPLDRKKPSLTHTVSYEAKCHLDTAPVSAHLDSALIGFSPVAANPDSGPGRYPWKYNITTTVFWIGEQATTGNPVQIHRAPGTWTGSATTAAAMAPAKERVSLRSGSPRCRTHFMSLFPTTM